MNGPDPLVMLQDLRRLVECESPSSDRDAIARSADTVADLGRRLLDRGPELVVIDGRTHLRWAFESTTRQRILLLGHHDTVWPIGSIVHHPWQVDDGIAGGPGCFDMKAGLVQLFHGLATLDDLSGLTILITGDEELGAPSSRSLIEAEARAARAGLVLEGSAPGGALKTARKGVALYSLTVTGRAAHAGLEPWAGINASVELAAQILAIAQLDAGPNGATVTPSLLTGGTTTNTVPASASVSIDCRLPSQIEFERVDAALRALVPHITGAELTLTGGLRHPPLEPSMSDELFQLAVSTSLELELDAPARASVGGASDGNLVAGVGTATLDGLGAVGGGAHTPDEHVVVATMAPRARLLAGIVDRLRNRS